MILVFDLDDTLYDEITFVYSGFETVSEYLSNEFNLDKEKIYNSLKKELHKNGRGRVFDTVFKKNKIYNQKLVNKCIYLYRLHSPKIKIHDDTKKLLESLSNFNKYIVTDGNKIVQKNKIKALKIEHYFKKIYITHNYGIKHSKPSLYCFNKILENEKIYDTNKLVYIGDNPNKDFVNLNKNGFQTVRILNGSYKNVRLQRHFEAQYQINELVEIKKIFELDK